METHPETLRPRRRRRCTIASAGVPPLTGVPTAAEFFDYRAPIYDAAYDASGSGGHTLRARMAVALDLIGSGPGNVLDAGMGPGRLCHALEQRGWTVSGVDSSQAMVDRARRRIGPAAVRMYRADLDRLPFADASFDAVSATGVMEYVHDRPAALEEIARVLRPGALAVVSVPNPVAFYARISVPHMRMVGVAHRIVYGARPARPVGGRRVRSSEFHRLLSDAGLRPEAIRHAGFLIIPLPFDNLVPGLAARLAGRLESRGPRLGVMLATQVVFAARR